MHKTETKVPTLVMMAYAVMFFLFALILVMSNKTLNSLFVANPLPVAASISLVIMVGLNLTLRTISAALADTDAE